MKSNKYSKEDQINLKLVIGLNRNTKKLTRESLQVFKEFNLTMAQFGVLEALYHKGDLTVNQLIESILSTSGNIGVVLKNLKKEDLIYKKCNPDDKRSSLIALSEKGKNLIETIFPEHLVQLEDSFGNLSYLEKQQLLQLLKKLSNKGEKEDE